MESAQQLVYLRMKPACEIASKILPRCCTASGLTMARVLQGAREPGKRCSAGHAPLHWASCGSSSLACGSNTSRDFSAAANEEQSRQQVSEACKGPARQGRMSCCWLTVWLSSQHMLFSPGVTGHLSCLLPKAFRVNSSA